jgi:hypothetical protein
MANTDNKNPTPERKPPATPEDIGKASISVAGLLSQYTRDEQSRIIRAAATINGLGTTSGAKR